MSSTINKSNYTSGVGGINDILGKYNSYTLTKKSNITVEPSSLYETYKPSKPSKSSSSYTKTITTTTRSRAPVTTTIKEYTSKTIKNSGKPSIITSKYLSSSNIPKYIPTTKKNETKNRFLDTQMKTETTNDYLTKITNYKEQLGGDYGSSIYTSSKEEITKPTYLETLNTETKESPTIDLPSSNGITAEFGATETNVEEKTKTYEDEKKEVADDEMRVDERGDRDERIEREERIKREERIERDERPEKNIERSEYKTTYYNLGYDDYLYKPLYGISFGYGYGPRPELGPSPMYDLGPRPTLGPMPMPMPLHGTYSQGTYGVFRHKPTCPLYEGNLYRMRAESQGNNGYDHTNNSFSGMKREYSEVKKYSSTGSRGGSIGRTYENAAKKSSKSGGGLSKYTFTKITTTTTGKREREGKNYNYKETKDIKKKKKYKPTTTLQYKRGGVSGISMIANDISQRYQRSTNCSIK